VTPDRPGKFSQLKVHESAAVTLTSYPGTLRQVIVTGLGRDAPTVIITGDHDIKTKALIERYARRMPMEQCLAEIIRAFCVDALSSPVNLNLDLDVMLAPRPGPLPALRTPLPGYATATPTPSSTAPSKPRPDHHHRRCDHRPPRAAAYTPICARPTCLRHHRPLVGQPDPAL